MQKKQVLGKKHSINERWGCTGNRKRGGGREFDRKIAEKRKGLIKERGYLSLSGVGEWGIQSK